MVLKVEDTQLVFDGKSVFKGFLVTYIIIDLCRSLYRAEKKYSAQLDAELKQIKKEQKLSKKKQKAESK